MGGLSGGGPGEASHINAAELMKRFHTQFVSQQGAETLMK
jgi:hypothetical protein